MAFIQVHTGINAVNGVPGATTDGVNLGSARHADQLMLLANNSSAGAGDTITLRVWQRSAENNGVNIWYPVGIASPGAAPVTNLTKGTLNNGGVIDLNGGPVNSASHAEMIVSLSGFSEFFAQAVAIVGTWDIALMTRKPGNDGLGQVR